MTGVLAVVVLAGVGATARAVLGDRLNGRGLGRSGLDLPWGTLAANLVASFLLAVVWGADVGGVALQVGGLGALSTWSTFAVETVELAGARRPRATALYVALTLVGAVAAAWLGLQAG